MADELPPEFRPLPEPHPEEKDRHWYTSAYQGDRVTAADRARGAAAP